MKLGPGLWAHVDQLVEEARETIDPQELHRPSVQSLLSDVIEFLSAPTDRIESHIRLLAFAEFVRSIQGDPPCSDPFSEGSS